MFWRKKEPLAPAVETTQDLPVEENRDEYLTYLRNKYLVSGRIKDAYGFEIDYLLMEERQKGREEGSKIAWEFAKINMDFINKLYEGQDG